MRRRSSRVLPGLVLSLLFLSCTDWGDWDRVFDRADLLPAGSRGWTGGDGAVSIPLPDGDSLLWIFGDSLLTEIDPATGLRVDPDVFGNVLFGTTVGLQAGFAEPDPAQIRFYARQGGTVSEITQDAVGGYGAFFSHAMLQIPIPPEDPAHPEEPPPPTFLWPAGGTCLRCDDGDAANDRLLIGFNQIRFCDPQSAGPECIALCAVTGGGDGEACTKGAKLLLPALAEVTNPNAPLASWTGQPVDAPRDDILWGASFFEEAGWLLVYGQPNEAGNGDPVVARVPVGSVGDPQAWQVWTAAGWQADDGTTPLAPVASGVGALFSVDRITHDGVTRYVLVHAHPLGDHFAFIRVSETPTEWAPLDAATPRLDLVSIDGTLSRLVDQRFADRTCPIVVEHGVVKNGACGVTYHGIAHDHLSFTGAGGITSLVFSYIVPVAPDETSLDPDYYRPRFGFFPLDFIGPWCDPAVHSCWKGINHQYALATVDPGQSRYYAFDVSGSDEFLTELSYTTGNPDLYVRFGDVPTLDEWDCRPHLDAGQAMERCVLTVPTGTERVWVMVRGRGGAPSDYSLRVSYDGVDGVVAPLL